jgi:hypothetical protein
MIVRIDQAGKSQRAARGRVAGGSIVVIVEIQMQAFIAILRGISLGWMQDPFYDPIFDRYVFQTILTQYAYIM